MFEEIDKVRTQLYMDTVVGADTASDLNIYLFIVQAKE